MKTIGIVYEISNNPYFGNYTEEYSNKISEYVKPDEIDELCSSLSKLGFEYELIDGANGLLEQKDSLNKYHLIFNKSIGFKGLERKLVVPAIAQLFNLPIIGTSGYSMTLARHKFHTNKLLNGMGFNVPFAYYVDEESKIPDINSYPVIVKPNAESDALGISENSVCYDYESMRIKVIELLKIFKQPVIIEKFISGEEWKVAVIGNDAHSKAYGCVNTLKNGSMMTGTLQTRDDIINDTLSYTSAQDSRKVSQVLNISEKIHRTFGLQDYSRCDFRIDENDEIYCMEVSTHPYLSKHNSSFCCAAMQTIASYDEVIKVIVQAAEIRYK